jgi:hypothetical protein
LDGEFQLGRGVRWIGTREVFLPVGLPVAIRIHFWQSLRVAFAEEISLPIIREAIPGIKAWLVVGRKGLMIHKHPFARPNRLPAISSEGRTLIVDAALRGPRLHEVFNVPNTAGLSGILSGRAESQVIQHVPDVSSLFLLPAGITPPNPLELIERPAFDLLLRELISKFDHVIVDTPAAIISSDAFVIAAKCGAALLLGRKDQSRLGALQDMVLSFNESPARLLGVVMNEH